MFTWPFDRRARSVIGEFTSLEQQLIKRGDNFVLLGNRYSGMRNITEFAIAYLNCLLESLDRIPNLSKTVG